MKAADLLFIGLVGLLFYMVAALYGNKATQAPTTVGTAQSTTDWIPTGAGAVMKMIGTVGPYAGGAIYNGGSLVPGPCPPGAMC